MTGQVAESSASATDSLVFKLTARPTAGAAARVALLADQDTLPAPVRDDVLLLLSELISNAVRHSEAGADGAVRVELRQRPDAVRVAVFDEGGGFTAEAPHSERDRSGGWGLFLVDQIADRWAVKPTATGTCAWFEIRHRE